MGISIQSILKGVRHRLGRKSRSTNFPALSWMLEKKLKHQEEQQLKKIKIGKLVFLYQRPYELLHTYRELFEEEIYRFNTENRYPFIIDCGANIGLSVLYFKSLYPQSKIIAFEPDVHNFSILKENLRGIL